MIQIEFPATNNIAEYEGLVTGLQLAKELGI
jgi:ribonuclease HI